MVDTDYLNELDSHGSYRGNELKQRNPALAATPAHWRAALFSVVFPLPRDVVFTDASLLDAPASPWVDGRYEGIKGVEYYPPASDAGHAGHAGDGASVQRMEFKNPKANPASYFGSDLAGYFRPGRGESAVYKHATRKSIHSWLENAAAGNPTRTEGWLAEAGAEEPPAPRTALDTALAYQLLSDVAAGAGLAKFGRLALRPGQWSAAGGPDDWEHGSLQLHAVEYLSYPPVASPPDGAETDPGQRFLVFHVLAENCSSPQLERISQALARPGNDFPAQLVEPSVPTSRHPSLPDAGAQAAGQALPYPLTQNLVEVAKLLLAPSETPAQLAGLRVAEDGALGDAAPPSRSVVALPAREDVPGPALFRQADDPAADEGWSPFEQWAWQLAAGADDDRARAPRQTRDNLERHTAEESERWSILSADGGVAAVRTDVDYRENPAPFVQAPTFFVELLVLNMRARAELAQLSGDRTSSPEPEAATEALARIQEQLWLDEIPRRPNLTQVLLTTRRTSGVQQLYDDVTSGQASPGSPGTVEPEHVVVTPDDAPERPADRRTISPAILAVVLMIGLIIVVRRSRRKNEEG